MTAPTQDVPAVVAIIAHCPFCDLTNTALITAAGARFTPSKCAHAVSANLTPPTITFSDTTLETR